MICGMWEDLFVVQFLRQVHGCNPWAIPILVSAGWSAGVAYGAWLWRRSAAQQAADARLQRHLIQLQSQLLRQQNDRDHA